MLRNRSTALTLFTLLLSTGGLSLPTGAAAQEPYSPLVPRGHVRLGVLGEYSSFSDLYRIGSRTDGPVSLGDLFGGPVGSRMFPFLAEPEASVRAAIEDDYEMSLGMMSSVLEKSVARVPVAVDVGVFDWLTVGAVVPLVQNETEFTTLFVADSAGANAGFSPGMDDPAAVTGFLNGLQGSIGAYDVFRGENCAVDPMSDACRDATQLLADARSFHSLLSLMYGSMFAPLSSSSAGMALDARLAAFAEAFGAAGITGTPAMMPLASTLLTAEDLGRLVSEPTFGIQSDTPFENWKSLWRLGDIEVRADARVFEIGDPESPNQFTLGAGAMARLPTGTQDDPANFLDSGSGDRQLDVELRGWMNGRWRGDFGLWADFRYGTQLKGSTVRRVSDPGIAFAPRSTETALDWRPGDYQFLELTPWYRLTDAMSIVGGYRFFRKGEDSFSIPAVVPVEETAAARALPSPAVDPGILVPGSGGSVGQALLGMVYNRGAQVGDDGVAGNPLEVRVMYRRTVGGSGGMPLAESLEVAFRFFVGIWGGRADPEE